jgi:hypothetical protein
VQNGLDLLCTLLPCVPEERSVYSTTFHLPNICGKQSHTTVRWHRRNS